MKQEIQRFPALISLFLCKILFNSYKVGVYIHSFYKRHMFDGFLIHDKNYTRR